MTRSTTAKAAAALALAALTVLVLQQDSPTATAPSAPTAPSVAADERSGDLYGRVTTYGGTVYEGPLRFGGGEETFWSHTFNGVKQENPWAEYAASGLPAEPSRPRIFGVELPWGERHADLRRPFMARFGDIAHIEARGDGAQGVLQDGTAFSPDVLVTLKSGTVVTLDRLSSSDFDDGVRVWDARGVVDLEAREIRSVDLLTNPRSDTASDQLYGTVQTRQGDFTGALQWDRKESLGRDRLAGRMAGGETGLTFDAVQSIVRDGNGSRVTTLDGGEVALSGSRKVGPGNRGVYVDDPRYGRVLVSWEAFERVDFSTPAGRAASPSYGDFPPGRRLTGTVTTRDGRRLAGRLVYDLDESETTETLDAPIRGVDYSIPFGQIASVVLAGRGEPSRAIATVVLTSGEELQFERAGDLGAGTTGLLVFASGQERPELVAWRDVARVDFNHPPSPSNASVQRRPR